MATDCNSWIITDEHGNAVFETYNKTTADAVNRAKYTVWTAYDYLVRLNRKIAQGVDSVDRGAVY